MAVDRATTLCFKAALHKPVGDVTYTASILYTVIGRDRTVGRTADIK